MTNETNPWNDVRSSSVNDRDAASAPRTDADAADGRMPGQQAQDRPGHGQVELPAISRSDAPGAPERDAAAGAAEASTPRPAPATPAAPVDPTNLPPRPDADAARREGTPNHNLAVAAVILGALSILLSAVPVIGLVLAVAAIWCAVRATRGTASTGMSTAGKVLGIAGTIISVLISLLYIAALLFAVDVVRGSYEYLSPEPLDALGDSETPALEPDRDLDEDERAAWDAVAARFDAIDPNDPALQGEVTEHLAGMLLDDGTQDLAPYGADAEAYATWMLVDLTYENTGIFVSGDTGTCFVDVEHRSPLDFIVAWATALDDAADDPANQHLPQDQAAVLMQEVFYGCLAGCTSTTDTSLVLKLERVDGAWTVTEDSWQAAMKNLFFPA